MKDDNLIFRKKVSASEIVGQYPAIWHDDYKKRLFDISCQDGCEHSGEIQISRWSVLPLPESVGIEAASTEFIFREDTFRYEVNSDENSVEWYLNFADGDLFLAYGSELMAQDEHQVAEHPILGSVREMLVSLSETDRRYDPCTRDYTRSDHNPPTPLIIMGAERRIIIDTSANIEQGRPDGLYGNLFRAASWDVIEKAVRRLDSPTITNIIAMEAPSGGRGSYTLEQITDIFQTAYTAFSAARSESQACAGGGAKTQIHTGNWGTGAYGGNRILIAYLQFLSAAAAKIDILVFHSLDGESCREAYQLFVSSVSSTDSEILVSKLLEELVDKGFQWGESDGN
jgi:hypothetical protein